MASILLILLIPTSVYAVSLTQKQTPKKEVQQVEVVKTEQPQVKPETKQEAPSQPAPVVEQPKAQPDIITSAAAAYGIPRNILAAVWDIESGKAYKTDVTSYAGAQGPMQFMPATWAAYGVDGNGDGLTDISNIEDAAYGAAHYLSANVKTMGSIEGALWQYNHSSAYVSEVLRRAANE